MFTVVLAKLFHTLIVFEFVAHIDALKSSVVLPAESKPTCDVRPSPL